MAPLLLLLLSCGGGSPPGEAAPGEAPPDEAAPDEAPSEGADDPNAMDVGDPHAPPPSDGPFQPLADHGGWSDPGFAAQDDPCPADMVAVPAGAFLSGATPEQVEMAPGWPDPEMYPRAREARRTGAYCIDRHEFPNVAGQPPTVWVGWLQAKEACRLRGRRLCTEDEWARACGGDEGWRFPYGDERVEGRCNDAVEPMGDSRQVWPIGEDHGCVSPYGAWDMDGNVSEFVDAVHDADPEHLRVLRGGTMWIAVYGRGCMARHAHNQDGPTHGDDGFRCCVDARTSTGTTSPGN
ncbi:MAG: SUMF1/EgtB/PvdO family nonheme iron enzyme [Alphaproteobacteria bacterium]|nr:SUMF1/EgtB/PvdO family nonheme iron enzyme [Alphaproteobacteria bacterium]